MKKNSIVLLVLVFVFFSPAFAENKAATDAVKTAGEPALLRLHPDRAVIAGDGLDLSFLTLSITDKEGVPAPRAKNLIPRIHPA